MKRLLLCALTTLCLVSCGKKETAFLRSYVMYYYGFEDIALSGSPETRRIVIMARGMYGMGNYKSTGTESPYDALCEKHSDMTFLREVVVWDGAGPRETCCFGIDFVSVDIVSDADYDGGHPAGSSLADIVKFESYSLKPYVDSGYTDCGEYIYGMGCAKLTNDLLSEYTSESLSMLGGTCNDGRCIGVLEISRSPSASKTHKFTVTMTADNGRTFTASVDKQFE